MNPQHSKSPDCQSMEKELRARVKSFLTTLQPESKNAAVEGNAILNLITELERVERGLVFFHIGNKLSWLCPEGIFENRAIELNEDYSWSLERLSDRKTLALVPRIKSNDEAIPTT